jgi:hypothetical protein
MLLRKAVEAALAEWRDAERRLAVATDGRRPALAKEVELRKARFQRLSGQHMMQRIDDLKGAEQRRMAAQPSTNRFHEAAREERELANDVWGAAMQSDEGTPRRTK